MHCGSSNPGHDYYMNIIAGDPMVLQKTLEEKDLEVSITSSLKPTVHCQKAASRAMSALRLLRSSFNSLTQGNFRILFTTYVRPHLEYCLQAVGPYMKKNIQTLERIQRRASKKVKGMKHLTYEDRLQRLNLMKIEDRAKRGDLIETYKIMTGKLNVDPDHFFQKETDAT